jgi:hypothetical protein
MLRYCADRYKESAVSLARGTYYATKLCTLKLLAILAAHNVLHVSRVKGMEVEVVKKSGSLLAHQAGRE